MARKKDLSRIVFNLCFEIHIGFLRRMEDGAIKSNLLNVRNKIEDGVKEKLERIYGVRITRDALTVSCNIARRCFDGWLFLVALLPIFIYSVLVSLLIR